MDWKHLELFSMLFHLTGLLLHNTNQAIVCDFVCIYLWITIKDWASITETWPFPHSFPSYITSFHFYSCCYSSSIVLHRQVFLIVDLVIILSTLISYRLEVRIALECRLEQCQGQKGGRVPRWIDNIILPSNGQYAGRIMGFVPWPSRVFHRLHTWRCTFQCRAPGSASSSSASAPSRTTSSCSQNWNDKQCNDSKSKTYPRLDPDQRRPCQHMELTPLLNDFMIISFCFCW